MKQQIEKREENRANRGTHEREFKKKKKTEVREREKKKMGGPYVIVK